MDNYQDEDFKRTKNIEEEISYLKLKADNYFKNSNYLQSIEIYLKIENSVEKITEKDKKTSLYSVLNGNISQAYLNMGDYDKSLFHSKKSLSFDDSNFKSYFRLIKSLMFNKKVQK